MPTCIQGGANMDVIQGIARVCSEESCKKLFGCILDNKKLCATCESDFCWVDWLLKDRDIPGKVNHNAWKDISKTYSYCTTCVAKKREAIEACPDHKVDRINKMLGM